MTTTGILLIIALIGIGIFLVLKIFRNPGVDIKDFSSRWRGILLEEVAYYRKLSPKERTRFELSILEFFQKVRITGVETKITDEDRLFVACSAVIPLFGYPGTAFDNISEVLIYNSRFNRDYQTHGKEDRNILGMVGSGAMNRHMILSKPALRKGFTSNKSQNVGIHEFVHLLDKADGSTDGIPQFVLQKKEVEPWLDIVEEARRAIISGDSSPTKALIVLYRPTGFPPF